MFEYLPDVKSGDTDARDGETADDENENGQARPAGKEPVDEVLSDEVGGEDEASARNPESHIDDPLEEDRRLEEQPLKGMRDEPRDAVCAFSAEPVTMFILNRASGKVAIQLVIRHRPLMSAVGGAGNEPAPAFGPDFGLPHQLGNGVDAAGVTASDQLLVDARATVAGLDLGVDGANFHEESVLTLFLRAAPDEPLFKLVLDQYFGGRVDSATDQRI